MTLPDVVGQMVVVHGGGLGHDEVGTGSVRTSFIWVRG